MCYIRDDNIYKSSEIKTKAQEAILSSKNVKNPNMHHFLLYLYQIEESQAFGTKNTKYNQAIGLFPSRLRTCIYLNCRVAVNLLALRNFRLSLYLCKSKVFCMLGHSVRTSI